MDQNMNDNNTLGSTSAYAALDDIPTPKADGKQNNNLGNLPSVSG